MITLLDILISNASNLQNQCIATYVPVEAKIFSQKQENTFHLRCVSGTAAHPMALNASVSVLEMIYTGNPHTFSSVRLISMFIVRF